MKMMIRGSLALALGLALAGPLSAQNRLPGDYANSIRPDRLKTPCRPFAADYAKGPPRALFFTAFSGAYGREVAELTQRFPLEIASIIYIGPDKLSNDDFWGAPVDGTFTAEKLQVLYRHLEKKWDVFVFGSVPFEALSPRAQYEILKQVSEGAGLIVVGRNNIPKTLLTNPTEDQGRRILAGVPFPNLPCYINLNGGVRIPVDQVPPGLLTTYSFGKGRIAVLSQVMRWENHSLTPTLAYT